MHVAVFHLVTLSAIHVTSTCSESVTACFVSGYVSCYCCWAHSDCRRLSAFYLALLTYCTPEAIMKDELQVSPGVSVDGTDCHVSSSASVARLASYAKSKLGRIDVWINNAGYSGSFQV